LISPRSSTKPCPPGHEALIASLKARIETLQREIARLEATATGHRADFERERDRADRLVAEVLKATADTMAAKEATAWLEGELAALRSRPWWRRVAG
jgi:chromosome segregation ATPase